MSCKASSRLAPGPSPWPARYGGRRTPPGGSIVSGRGRAGCCLTIGHRGALQHQPALGAGGHGRTHRPGATCPPPPRPPAPRPGRARPPPAPVPVAGHRARAAASTKRVSLGRLRPVSKRRSALAPTSSKTSTGSTSPFTGTGPRAFTRTSASTSPRVLGVSRMLLGAAICPYAPPGLWSLRRPSSPCAGHCQSPAPPLPPS